MALLPDEIATEKASREREGRLVAHFVAKIKETFGPPPLVDGENPKEFDRILAELVRARCPTDVFIQMDAWDIAVAIWLDKRYNRASKLVLDRKIGENVEFQRQRSQQKFIQADNDAQRNDGSANDQRVPEKLKGELPADIEKTPQEILVAESATEEANALAFERAMPLLTDLDDLKTRNFFRRNVSRQMWAERRPGFIPPLAIILHKLNSEIQAEDQRAWLDELRAEEMRKQNDRTEKPAKQPHLPTVPAPGLGNP